MNKEQEMVKEFHLKFGFTINEKPTKLTDRLWRIRYNHTLDELLELQLAEQGLEIGMNGLEKVADALGDILYFVYGTAVAHGIDMESIIKEIHRSNMTKDRPEGGGDAKAVKGKDYSPPDIESILISQGRKCDITGKPQSECHWYKTFGSCNYCPPALDEYDRSVVK